jgi:hypothetical protein
MGSSLEILVVIDDNSWLIVAKDFMPAAQASHNPLIKH